MKATKYRDIRNKRLDEARPPQMEPTNKETVKKDILKALKKGGYLVSSRGSRGNIQVNRLDWDGKDLVITIK